MQEPDYELIQWFDTTEAGAIMGISRRRVLALIKTGQLKARWSRYGWRIRNTDIATVKRRPTAGNPNWIDGAKKDQPFENPE